MAATSSTTKTTLKAAVKPAVKAAAKAATPKAAVKVATPAAKGKTAAVAKAPVKPVTPTTVTLKHLSAGLAGRHGMEKKQADAVVADVFEIVVGHLRSGERVRIGGFGILEVKDRPARMGRNPTTGEAVQIAASRKVAFRVAKDLKSTI